MTRSLRPIRWLCYPWKVMGSWRIGFGPGGRAPQDLMPGAYQSREAASRAAGHANQSCDVFDSYVVDLEEETTLVGR